MTEGYRAGGFDSSEGGAEEAARGLAISYLEAHGLFVERGERWACDCEGAPIVAGDGRQAILVSVLARAEADSEAVPSLELGRDDVMAMRRACLLYALDHEDVESIRHDAISVVITGGVPGCATSSAPGRGTPSRTAGGQRPTARGSSPSGRSLPQRPQPSPPAAAFPAVRDTWRRRGGERGGVLPVSGRLPTAWGYSSDFLNESR